MLVYLIEYRIKEMTKKIQRITVKKNLLASPPLWNSFLKFQETLLNLVS